MAKDYQSPEHSGYALTRYNVLKKSKRTGFKWLYNVTPGMRREVVDIRPGSVDKGVLADIDYIHDDSEHP